MPDTTYNLQKGYAALNESIAHLFDESGVRRSFTVPYLAGQEMPDHISTVAQAAADAGGFTNNFITTAHKSTGKGWGSPDGETVGHPVEKLRNATIPAQSEHAKAVLDVAQRQISSMKSLLGDKNPVLQTAQSQLDLVKKTDGQGMNLLDFGVLMIQLMFRPIQEIAQAHSGTKDGGHAPQLRVPNPGQAPEEAEAAPDGSESPAGGTEAPASPETPVAAAPAAPAAPVAAAGPSEQAQG